MKNDGKHFQQRACNLKNYELKCDQMENPLQQSAQDLTGQREGIEGFSESEAAYRTLFESASDSILIFEEGRLIHCNPISLQMFACSRKQLIGKTPADISPQLQPDGWDSGEKALQLIKKVEQGIPQVFEWRHQRFDGSQFDAEINLAPLNKPGKKAFIGIVRDISDRKQMESILERERDQAKMYLDVAEVILLALDKEGRIELINRKGCSILGYEEQELIGENFFEKCLPVAIRSRVKEIFRKIMAGEIDAYEYHENELLTASGDEKIIAWHNAVLQNGTGQKVGTLSSGEDITKRKKAEIKLQQSEERYRALFESASDAILLLEKERILECNQKCLDVFACTKQQILNKSVLDLSPPIQPSGRRSIEESNHNIKLGQEGVAQSFEWRHQRPDGSQFDAEVNLAPFDRENPSRAIAIVRDVTLRKQTEAALKKSEERFKLISETIDEVFWISDIEKGIVTYASPGLERISGYSIKDFPKSREFFFDMVHIDDKQQAISTMNEQIETGQAIDCEFRIIRPDGTVRHLWNRATPVSDESGHIINYVGVLRDISDRKNAEIELMESKDYLNQVINCIGDPIFVKDEEHRYVLVNDALCTASGLDREELIGKTNYHYKPKEQADDILNEELSILKNGQESVIEEDSIDRNGRKVTVMTKRTLLTDKLGNKQIVGAIRDITRQKELEAQFMQAQKMEAVGVLAGGVAHDFNNLLTVINGYSNMLLEEFDQGDSRREDLEEINKAGQRAASLTSQLLAFSRQQIINPKILNVNDVIEDTSKILHRLIGEDIELALNLQPDLGMVKADLGQIQQVIMNLAVNAREAMPRGGKLTLQTANADLNEEFVRKYPYVKTGSYIMLSVSDTGIGMIKATIERIFEPFFTTKELKKGTGLGLSTVYGIVKQSDGYIWAYSEPGMGATFKVYLPHTAGKAERLFDYGEEESGNGENETILMVEDEPSVQALAIRILGKKGYNVLKASTPKDALRIGQDFTGKIDLILTDVVMPEMNVMDLIDQIKAKRPDIKVLLMSGYTDDTIVNHGILKPDIAFISKPFTTGSLVKKVRKVLDSNSSN